MVRQARPRESQARVADRRSRRVSSCARSPPRTGSVLSLSRCVVVPGGRDSPTSRSTSVITVEFVVHRCTAGENFPRGRATRRSAKRHSVLPVFDDYTTADTNTVIVIGSRGSEPIPRLHRGTSGVAALAAPLCRGELVQLRHSTHIHDVCTTHISCDRRGSIAPENIITNHYDI